MFERAKREISTIKKERREEEEVVRGRKRILYLPGAGWGDENSFRGSGVSVPFSYYFRTWKNGGKDTMGRRKSGEQKKKYLGLTNGKRPRRRGKGY